MTFGEMGIHNLYPLPPGIDMHNDKMLSVALSAMPTAAFVLLLLNYMVCSFVGGVVGALFSGRTAKVPIVIIGLLLTLAGAYNLTVLHHPLWFSVIAMLIYFPFTYFGYYMLYKKPA
jgi:CHASE2 domain-containing sensor protein